MDGFLLRSNVHHAETTGIAVWQLLSETSDWNGIPHTALPCNRNKHKGTSDFPNNKTRRAMEGITSRKKGEGMFKSNA